MKIQKLSVLIGLVSLTVVSSIEATNFAHWSTYHEPGYGAEAGSGDNGVTAWTYVSFYNYGGTKYNLYTRDIFSTTQNIPDTLLVSFGPALVDSIDTGHLWESSTDHCGASEIWRIYPNNIATNVAVAYVYK